jgi:hypothetical protein
MKFLSEKIFKKVINQNINVIIVENIVAKINLFKTLGFLGALLANLKFLAWGNCS